MELVWKNSMWGIVSMFLWAGTPMLVTLVTFFVYTLSGNVLPPPPLVPSRAAPPSASFSPELCARPFPLDAASLSPSRRQPTPPPLLKLALSARRGVRQELKPNVAFTSLALFNVMRFPLSFLPMIINFIIESRCALPLPGGCVGRSARRLSARGGL
jgi:hypothetical protein